MDYKEIVKCFIEFFGGKENIISVVYCVIRLCLVMKDELKID